MGAITLEALYDYVGAVGLEGHAVITVIDDGVLDCNAAGAVGVPAVGVLSGVVGFREAGDKDIGEGDRRAVSNKVVVFRAVYQVKIGY